MRHLTIDYVQKLVQKALGNLGAAATRLQMDRRPRPMPGRRWPTHVAWFLQIAKWHKTPLGYDYTDAETLSYVGKPNRYRAIEARKFLTKAKAPGWCLRCMWQAEFDKAGLVAYISQAAMKQKLEEATGAFRAYHPHSPTVEIVEAFVKPLFVKYIGGMRLYSQKRRLTTDALDAYYEWYQKQFKRRLRRPKPVATALVAGQPVEAEAEGALEAPEVPF